MSSIGIPSFENTFSKEGAIAYVTAERSPRFGNSFRYAQDFHIRIDRIHGSSFQVPFPFQFGQKQQ